MVIKRDLWEHRRVKHRADQAGRAPTCREPPLPLAAAAGAVVLTRGSSSCTISPLAKIRTILAAAAGPGGVAPAMQAQSWEKQPKRSQVA